jgi:succinate dehydrogenase hydrophobic anchor subunit
MLFYVINMLYFFIMINSHSYDNLVMNYNLFIIILFFYLILIFITQYYMMSVSISNMLSALLSFIITSLISLIDYLSPAASILSLSL